MNTSHTDPLGLYQRVPELEQLAERLPKLRDAIESGRPDRVYRLVAWGVLRRAFGDIAYVAKDLLANRRLFLKPLVRPPRMYTYNGIGSRLHGRSEVDLTDGTYIATLFFVVFYLPIYPIASYLVSDGAPAKGFGFFGKGRSWGFMAKAPLSSVSFVWQKAVALAGLGAIVMGGVEAAHGYRHNTITIVNGLNVPVMVAIEGEPQVRVAAHGEYTVPTTTGLHRVTAQTEGGWKEEGALQVAAGSYHSVWNVAGAAPVYLTKVIYSAKGTETENDELPQMFCGQNAIEKVKADYAFVEAPKTISMSSHEKTVTRMELGVVPTSMVAADVACLQWLSNAKKDKVGAARLAFRMASAERASADTFEARLGNVAHWMPKDEAEAFAKAAILREPSVNAHRFYQDVLQMHGERARAIREYADDAAKHPDSPDAAYLAVRLLPPAEALPKVDALVQKFPNHTFLRRTQVWAHALHYDFKGAAAAAGYVHDHMRSTWFDMLQLHVMALSALGRESEARDLMDEVVEDPHASEELQSAARRLTAEIDHRLGRDDDIDVEVANTLRGDPKGKSDDEDVALTTLLTRAFVGAPMAVEKVEAIKDADLKRAVRITLDAQRDGDSAISRLKSAKDEDLKAVPDSVRGLLFAEALRRGDSNDLLGRIRESDWVPAWLWDASAAYVQTGVIRDDLDSAPLEFRAALDFARSRREGIGAEERVSLVARAKTGDPMRGPVTLAIQRWH